jgi:hypothetical protein
MRQHLQKLAPWHRFVIANIVCSARCGECSRDRTRCIIDVNRCKVNGGRGLQDPFGPTFEQAPRRPARELKLERQFGQRRRDAGA